jgi:hypothetical protein
VWSVEHGMIEQGLKHCGLSSMTRRRREFELPIRYR